MPTPMSYDIELTLFMVAIFVTSGASTSSLPERIAASPGSQRHLYGTWHCRHALHRHGGNAGHAEINYDRLFVALSVVIAIGAATAALWLAFRTRNHGQKLAAAIVMGLAISGMHYTGMRAAIFTAHDPTIQAAVSASLDQTNLALAVAGITFMTLACVDPRCPSKRAEGPASAPKISRINRVGAPESWPPPGARSQSTDCRRRLQRRCLLEVARCGDPKSQRGTRGCQNVKKRNACRKLSVGSDSSRKESTQQGSWLMTNNSGDRRLLTVTRCSISVHWSYRRSSADHGRSRSNRSRWAPS